ncbi:siderophore synthetase phosphopantetheinyl transferase subunit [Alistipes sp.]|uniref:4'-phosphopantetheinyl transferase family protein n=1 Tax=Alistipes sp. TaxID=1872444 RepID=UPI0025C02577|nr:siderophore synthetase phosphopantetheinyl transferase subunit [Alistipes sp.]
MNRLLTAQPEQPAALDGWITADELTAAAAFGSERRRREYLTWRAVVRRTLGRDVRIGYDANGTPQLFGLSLHLSVSHCADLVAVALSEAPCAVDAEPADRDFSRVQSRYLTPFEESLSADPLWPAVAWCAKETLYKYARRRELDLCRDLRLVGADLAAGRVAGRIGDGAPLPMRIDRVEGALVVSLFGSPDAPYAVERLLF